MNHLQTLLEYIDIDSKIDNKTETTQNTETNSSKKPFSLDVDTAI